MLFMTATHPALIEATERGRPKMMTAIAIMFGVVSSLPRTRPGLEVVRQIAVLMVGGIDPSTLRTPLVPRHVKEEGGHKKPLKRRRRMIRHSIPH
jgi:Cu/Ag efflux pump CusA